MGYRAVTIKYMGGWDELVKKLGILGCDWWLGTDRLNVCIESQVLQYIGLLASGYGRYRQLGVGA